MQIILQNGKIVGTQIINYLLEKSRVTIVGPNERNYHAFYSLIASPDHAAKYELSSTASSHRMLDMGGRYVQ